MPKYYSTHKHSAQLRRKSASYIKKIHRRRRVSITIMILLLVCAIYGIYAIGQNIKNDKAAKNDDSVVVMNPEETTTNKPVDPKNEIPIALPDATETPSSDVINEDYDFASPMPESKAVEDEYFDDAMFLGDSRTAGFMLYSGLKNTSSLTDTGIMINEVFTKSVISDGGKKITLVEALEKQNTFKKIYIMFGVNELGWQNFSFFTKEYEKLIDKVREINPKAIIYIQSVLPVTAEKASSNKIYTNKHINSLNDKIKQVCETKKVYYLDVAEAVKNQDGVLPSDAATDGVHMNKAYCEKWLEYLKIHTVN